MSMCKNVEVKAEQGKAGRWRCRRDGGVLVPLLEIRQASKAR
jgi:hypothetical protein